MKDSVFSRGKKTAIYLLFFLVSAAMIFTFTPASSRAEVTVSASLNPDRFAVGTGGLLTITVNGGKSADIRLPSLSGVSFQGRGRSSQVQIINGSFSSSLSYTYFVQAENPGKYTIPPITVSVDGNTLNTKAIAFEATQAGTATPGTTGTSSTKLRAGEADKIAFLRISELKNTSWTGEVLPLRIKAYFRQGIKASLNSLPVLKGDGFVLPQLDSKPLQTEENVDGTIYSVLTWESYISAVKDGKHDLTFELEATLLFPQRRNMFPGLGDQDLFQDDFFQNFFGGFERKNVRISSRPITIEAKQLPTGNRPPGFTGAIGNFNLSVQAQPTTVEAGEPITMTMVVSGSGNFDRVEAPVFPDNAKWKTYPPSAEYKQEGKTTQGKKKFEQALVVKDEHITEIPSVSFSFFDPAGEKYVTLTSSSIPLSVRPGRQEKTPGGKSAPDLPAVATPKAEDHGRLAGLAPIHRQLGSLQKKITPLSARPWFFAMPVFCTILLLAIFAWKVRLRYLHAHPELIRKKNMDQLLIKNMLQVQEAAALNDSSKYLAACRRAIQEHLGNLWQIKTQAITLSDLKARLQPSSILIVVFEAAEKDAYASYPLSSEQMRQFMDTIEKELAGLQ